MMHCTMQNNNNNISLTTAINIKCISWWCFVWRATVMMWVEFYFIYELCDLHVVQKILVL